MSVALSGRTATKISRTITYGICATVHLARVASGEPVSCTKLARQLRLPNRYLLQVLRCLVANGTLRSTRGVSGGYVLARAPNKITLHDVMDAFNSPFDVTRAELKSLSPAVRSKVFESLQSVSDTASARLQKVTLADLLRTKRKV